jgi:hypothetical protein
MKEIKNMKEKWLFIIRPNRTDAGGIVHWTIADADTDGLDDFVREEFGSDACWVLTDKRFNDIIRSKKANNVRIVSNEEETWFFVCQGYMARACYIPTGEAFDIMDASFEELLAEAEEMLAES